LSSNLRNKSFVFKNQQLSKEEYKNAILELQLGTYSGQLRVKEEFNEIVKKSIHKYAHIKNSVNVIGDLVENSKNIYYSYGVVNSENVKYLFLGQNVTTDSQDLIFSGRLEECYETTLSGRGGIGWFCRLVVGAEVKIYFIVTVAEVVRIVSAVCLC